MIKEIIYSSEIEEFKHGVPAWTCAVAVREEEERSPFRFQSSDMYLVRWKADGEDSYIPDSEADDFIEWLFSNMEISQRISLHIENISTASAAILRFVENITGVMSGDNFVQNPDSVIITKLNQAYRRKIMEGMP